MMSNKQLYFYSALSGLLLGLAYLPGSTGIFLFIGFIPLLTVEAHLAQTQKSAKHIIKFAITAFLIWNASATWWIYHASFAGMLMAFLVNTFLFTAVFWFFHFTHKKTNHGLGYFAFIVYWLTFEHFYLNAEISWPWLTLGFGFAEDIRIIQWYEFTGSLGGSLWALMVNVLLFNFAKPIIFQEKKPLRWRESSIPAVVLIVPIIISITIFSGYTEEENPVEIVVVQPNIDPYEKFVAVSNEEVTSILINLADSLADEDTDYIVAPETAIVNNIWLHMLWHSEDIQRIKQFVSRYDSLKYVVGIMSRALYESPLTPTANPLGQTGKYYDTFNSAIQIDQTDSIQVYHKSQLVVGVEKMPYPEYLGFLKKIMLQLGGTFRSHGTQENRANLISPNGNSSAAPVICYESIFGEYVTGYIKNGASIIFIITNDGWWADTPGYKQHNAYARLRAIETRRSIARSANTGISSFINQRGEVLQAIGWWERDAIKEILNENHKLTFYTRHGDYIARLARFFALLAVAALIVRIILNKKSM
ncbi:MAG: apolipoprotein N-acyltransferase [Bacteroidota bacterium]